MTKRVNDCFQRFIAARSRGEVQIRVLSHPVMLLRASPLRLLSCHCLWHAVLMLQDPMLEELAEELARVRSRSSHTLSAPESLEIVV